MARLKFLIIMYIKKIPRSIWNSTAHFRKKGKEPIRYVVVRKNMLYTPNISVQAKTFRRALLAHLQGISPSAGGTPCQFLFYNVFAKNACIFFCIGASICIGQESLFLLYAGFFLFLIWDGSWSYLIVIFQLAKLLYLPFYTL